MTTSIQEVKVFVDDAIQLLQQNHDVNTALARLKLADQQLGAQSVQTTSGNFMSSGNNVNRTNNEAKNQTSVTAGNSTINLKLGNKAYPIKYQLIGGKLTAISAEKDNITLLLNISSTSNGKLTIELPRYVIDSKKQGNVDGDFTVFADGQYTTANEIKNNSNVRTLMVGFDNGTSVIEINGTHIVPVQSSTTTKFLEYENSTYGIKMQYPSHWRVEGASNSSIVASFYPQTNNVGYVTVEIENLTTNYTPHQYLNSLMRGDTADYKDFPDIRFTNNTTSNIVLAGHPGYLLNGTFRNPTSDALQRFTNTGTIIGGREYSVIYYSPAETYPAYNTIYDQMIKSFEVIPLAVNANPTSNTTNLVSDVRVISPQCQRTGGFIFLIHYMCFGTVANFGGGGGGGRTSGPITVHLQITGCGFVFYR